MRSAVIDARGLCKRYGDRLVVDEVTFSLTPGHCLGLLGPNGAGKTTTIRMVTCLAPPSGGTLEVFGLTVEPRNHRAIKTRLGIMQQEESLDPDLSVEMNLVIYAGYFGIPRADAARRAAATMAFAEIEQHRHARIRTLSGGMKRRLMLGRALLNHPDLLVLDEPTTGLDPQARRLVWERVRTLTTQGTTILLTTHYMEEAAQLCDRVIIMDAGRIVAEGPPAELVASRVGREVVEIHLAGDPIVDGRLLAAIADGPWRSEQVGRIAYVYVQDGLVAPNLPLESPMHRQTRRAATLEDVFLSLTGHALRD